HTRFSRDWSSDVCSSDLFMTMANRCKPVLTLLATAINYIGQTKFYPVEKLPPVKAKPLRLLETMAKNDLTLRETAAKLCVGIDRSEERRVGKEGSSRCR